MAGRRQRSARDRRRRTHGQNFLVDRSVVDRLVARLELAPGELVLEVGAGRGALTLPLARAGADVIALERDRGLVRGLRERVSREGLTRRVDVRRADLREAPWPTEPYRVVANPPFALTTSLLSRLLDDPARGPTRADLLLQWEVARKRAETPPTTLRSAAWAPWWRFELGEKVPRQAFRPVPAVDAGVLVITRREPPVLPPGLAADFADVLRPAWEGANHPGRRRADGSSGGVR